MKVSLTKVSLVLFPVLVVMLLLADAFLLLQNAQLKADILASRTALELRVGQTVPPLHGLDMDGRELTVTYDAEPRKTLFLAFSPSCGICTENWPSWARLLHSLKSSAVRVVLVDTSSQATKEYLTKLGMHLLPVVRQVDPKSMIDYRFRQVPQTVLVGSDGRILGVWTGMLDGGRLAEVKNAILKTNEKPESAAVHPAPGVN